LHSRGRKNYFAPGKDDARQLGAFGCNGKELVDVLPFFFNSEEFL
jgi:hypothetical protein